ncbi:MAG: radical SAM protein [archaeon]
MAKVLLVQPNKNLQLNTTFYKTEMPISLVYMGTAIEEKHDVKIYDRNLNVSDSDFLRFLKRYNPDIIGFTLMTSEMIIDFMHLGKIIKKEFPEKIIIVGGVHTTIEPDSVLNESYVDYIIRGEGEETFLEFCNTFDKNPRDLKKIKNINHNPLRPFVNMDDLELPNYNLVNLKKYGTYFIHLSRGCPGNCTFCYSCGMWGVNNRPLVRSYGTEKIMNFFKKVVNEYDLKYFTISDDNFIPFKSRAIKVCNFLKDYNVHFFCYGRADYVSDEILRPLKKAGCHTIQIGVESGSQRILDLLNKRTTIKQNADAIACCKRNKIHCDASLMIGMPTETREDLKMTLDFLKKTRPNTVNLKVYNPLPGPPLFDYCVEKGLLKKPENLEGWSKWAGGFFRVQHNVSEIPNQELMAASREGESIDYYKNKFKKFIYWLKAGNWDYVLRQSRLLVKTPRGLKIPLIGYLKAPDTYDENKPERNF